MYKNLACHTTIFFSLHTYLVGVEALKNAFNYGTRPPLHIGASRIVEYPSGSSPAEFLIAYNSFMEFHFSLRSWAECSDLKKSLRERRRSIYSGTKFATIVSQDACSF